MDITLCGHVDYLKQLVELSASTNSPNLEAPNLVGDAPFISALRKAPPEKHVEIATVFIGSRASCLQAYEYASGKDFPEALLDTLRKAALDEQTAAEGGSQAPPQATTAAAGPPSAEEAPTLVASSEGIELVLQEEVEPVVAAAPPAKQPVAAAAAATEQTVTTSTAAATVEPPAASAADEPEPAPPADPRTCSGSHSCSRDGSSTS